MGQLELYGRVPTFNRPERERRLDSHAQKNQRELTESETDFWQKDRMNVRITRGNKTVNLTGLHGQWNIHRTKSAKDSMEGR